MPKFTVEIHERVVVEAADAEEAKTKFFNETVYDGNNDPESWLEENLLVTPIEFNFVGIQ